MPEILFTMNVYGKLHCHTLKWIKKTPEKYPKNSPYDCFTSFRQDLLCKNHFIKVFEHSCVAAMCENNMPIIVKSTHKFFYNLQNHKQSLRTVSDSPSVHVTEGKKSRPFVTLPYRHTRVRSCGPLPLLITCCSCWRYLCIVKTKF